MNDWQKNTIYRHYTKNSKQIQWFWQVSQGKVLAGTLQQSTRHERLDLALMDPCCGRTPSSLTLSSPPPTCKRR